MYKLETYFSMPHIYNYHHLDHFLTTEVTPAELSDQISESMWMTVSYLIDQEPKEKDNIKEIYYTMKQLRNIIINLKQT